MTDLAETTRRQIAAADPARSAFVMANAGAGKTRVLTDRVSRLLLQGHSPSRILCVTFTKAAASEMSERLLARLGEWALKPDDELRAHLNEIEGAVGADRSEEELRTARGLFARALETPGGLKIQTIHSFCETVLKSFPFEAGIAPGFVVLEDKEAASLLERALEESLVAASSSNLERDLSQITCGRSATSTRAIIMSAVKDRARLERQRTRFATRADFEHALAKALGVDPADRQDDLRKRALDEIDDNDLRDCKGALEDGSSKLKSLAARIGAYLNADDEGARWTKLQAVFLKKDGAPLKTLTTNPFARDHAHLEHCLTAMKAIVVKASDLISAARQFSDNRSLYRIVFDIVDRYEDKKRERSALDFDDLIASTAHLLENADTDWVRYRLDNSVEHILLDEAQDTSPSQWRIIEALIREHLSGEGAHQSPRSFFAVGDVKQSIYSFQGADAALFDEKEQDLGKRLAARAEADRGFQSFELPLSFRTTTPVLRFVDEAFKRGAEAGLGKSGSPRHEAHRRDQGGLVELWPLTPRPETPKANPWDAPVDQPIEGHPSTMLAERIAETIDLWIREGRPSQSRARPVVAGDFLILMQSRTALFHEILHSLAAREIPIAGADRITLPDEPAVADLISLARFCVQPLDDLSLAEALKSPLFEFDDDTDLFPLCYDRAHGESLWRRLLERGHERPRWARAASELQAAVDLASAHGPYSLFEGVLQSGEGRFESGRQRFYRYFGESARDGVDELLTQALVFEQKHPSSTLDFLHKFSREGGVVKRELAQKEDCVRVMTVHGAKGLEADIVILADAHRLPRPQRSENALPIETEDQSIARERRLTLYGSSSKTDSSASRAARKAAEDATYDEYRRLFYVAATRARDTLYIAGLEQSKSESDKPVQRQSWHQLAVNAFDHLDGAEKDDAPFWPGGEAAARRIAAPTSAPQPSPAAAAPTEPMERRNATPPDWLFQPAPREASRSPIAPSQLFSRASQRGSSIDFRRYSVSRNSDFHRGRIIHKLLELLPPMNAEARRAAADRYLARAAPDISAEDRATWRDEVFAILNDENFAPVFAPSSRAEVAIGGSIAGPQGDVPISGRIDRLVVEPKRVLIVDFKTNRPPPTRIDDIGGEPIVQLAAYRALLQEIYKDHEISCALLWTYAPRLMPVPADLLDHALVHLLETA